MISVDFNKDDFSLFVQRAPDLSLGTDASMIDVDSFKLSIFSSETLLTLSRNSLYFASKSEQLEILADCLLNLADEEEFVCRASVTFSIMLSALLAVFSLDVRVE